MGRRGKEEVDEEEHAVDSGCATSRQCVVTIIIDIIIDIMIETIII